MGAMTDQQAGYRLAHPVYLDVQMMISFLAYLEGGVVTQEEETTRETGARERALRARSGGRFRLPWAAEVDASLEGSAQRRDEVASESRSARHHTSASLFNLLYQYLHEDDQLTELREESQLFNVRTGDLVELAGEYLGNPLEEVLAFLATLYPYVLEQQEAQRAAAVAVAEQARRSQRSGNPSRRTQATTPAGEASEALDALLTPNDATVEVQMMLRMAEDLRRVPVHDVLMKTAAGLRVVLTVSSEYYSSETNEYLRAGEFRVIGKVTRVLTGGETINLTRRTVLGVAGPAVAQEVVGLVQTDELRLDVADPIVEAPAVQVLPMAIFL